MKIENYKIVEATEEELFDYYLTQEYDDIIDFKSYKDACIKNGTCVVTD